MRIVGTEFLRDLGERDVSYLAYTNARRQWLGDQCVFYDRDGVESLRLIGGTNACFPSLRALSFLRNQNWQVILLGVNGSETVPLLCANGRNDSPPWGRITDIGGHVIGQMAPLLNGYEFSHSGRHIAKTEFSPLSGTTSVNGFIWRKASWGTIPFPQKGIWLVLENLEDRILSLERLLALALTPIMGRIQGRNEMLTDILCDENRSAGRE